jgi:hypothetical protein
VPPFTEGVELRDYVFGIDFISNACQLMVNIKNLPSVFYLSFSYQQVYVRTNVGGVGAEGTKQYSEVHPSLAEHYHHLEEGRQDMVDSSRK